ncbi:MAG: hypothetical protein WC867_05265 [Candidatus Pacearchaeota archaeon]|jgi:hypothetical protein
MEEQRFSRRTALKAGTLSMLVGLTTLSGCSSKVSQKDKQSDLDPNAEIEIHGFPISLAYSPQTYGDVNRLSFILKTPEFSGSKYTQCKVNSSNNLQSNEVCETYNLAASMIDAFTGENRYNGITVKGKMTPKYLEVHSIEGILGEDNFYYDFRNEINVQAEDEE